LLLQRADLGGGFTGGDDQRRLGQCQTIQPGLRRLPAVAVVIQQ